LSTKSEGGGAGGVEAAAIEEKTKTFITKRNNKIRIRTVSKILCARNKTKKTHTHTE
jgi:hypothetical protein